MAERQPTPAAADPFTAKTIARIERGETEAPHGHTLKAIAARLGGEPGEIMSY